MSKHEQNSQNFANQNKTSYNDTREKEGGLAMQTNKNRPQPRSNKKDGEKHNKF